MASWTDTTQYGRQLQRWRDQVKQAHLASQQGESFDPIAGMDVHEFSEQSMQVTRDPFGITDPTGKKWNRADEPTFQRPVHYTEAQSYDERRRILSGHQMASPEQFKDFTASELKGSFVKAGGAEFMGISRTEAWKLNRAEVELEAAKFHAAWVPTLEQQTQPFSAAPEQFSSQVSAGEVEASRQRLGLPSLSPIGLPENARTRAHNRLFQSGAQMGMTRTETYRSVQEGIQQGALGGEWHRRVDPQSRTNTATYGQQYLQERFLGPNYQAHVQSTATAATPFGFVSQAQWQQLPQHLQTRLADMRLPDLDKYGQPIQEEGRFMRGGKYTFPESAITDASFLGRTPDGRVITTWGKGKSEKRVQTLGAHKTLQVNTLTSSPAFLKEGPASQRPETLRQNVRGALILGGDVGGPGAGLFDFGAGARAHERVYRSLAPSPTGETIPVQRGAVFSPGSEMALAAGATGEHTGKWRYQVEDVFQQEGGGYSFVLQRSAAMNQARVAFKDASSKAQGMGADLSGVTTAGGEALNLQFMAARKDLQGAVFSRYAGMGTSALSQDVHSYLTSDTMKSALAKGAYKGYGLPSQLTPESIDQYVRGRSYSELGSLPVRAYSATRLKDDLKEIHYPQIMTRENMEKFREGGSIHGTPEDIGGGRVRATVKYQAIVGELGKLISEENPFKRPFLSAEEMESVKRANPAEYERLYAAGTPTRERYQEVMNAALASSGDREMPGFFRNIGQREAGALHSVASSAANAGLPEGATASRGRVARQLIDQLAAGEHGDTPMRIGSGTDPLFLPSPKTMQAMGAPSEWEGSEETRVMRMAAEAFAAFGSGDKGAFDRLLNDRTVTNEIGEEETIPGLRTELRNLAGGGEFRRRTMGTALDRRTAHGDIAHMSLALKPNEAYVPQLGDPGSMRNRVAQVLRFPSQMTRAHDPNAGMKLLSRSQAEKLGLNMSVAQFSPEALQAMAGDVDGDKFLAYIRGDATVDKQGNLVGNDGSPMGSLSAIQHNAFRAANEGAASPMDDMAGTAANPFVGTDAARAQWQKEVSGMRALSTQELRGDYESLSFLRNKIGQLYLPFRAAAGQVAPEAMESFETMWLASHGRAQRPARQIEGMERFHTVLKTGLVTNPKNWKAGQTDYQRRLGGGNNPMIADSTKSFQRFRSGGRGVEGAFTEATQALGYMKGDQGELLIRGQGMGTLFGGTEEAVTAIGEAATAYQAATPGTPESAALEAKMVEAVLAQGHEAMFDAPIGQMIMPKATEAGLNKMLGAGLGLSEMAQTLGVDEPLLQEQLNRREAQKARLQVFGRKNVAANVAADMMEKMGFGWLGKKIRPGVQDDINQGADAVFDAVFPGMKKPSIVQSAGATRRSQAAASKQTIQGAPSRGDALLDFARGSVSEMMGGRSARAVARVSQHRRRQGGRSLPREAFMDFMTGMPAEDRPAAAEAWRTAVGEAGIPMFVGDQGANVHDLAAAAGGTYDEWHPGSRASSPAQANAPSEPDVPPWDPSSQMGPSDDDPRNYDMGEVPMGSRERNRRRANAARPDAEAGIPVMMTSQMRSQLSSLGFTSTQIGSMTPRQAWTNINNAARGGTGTGSGGSGTGQRRPPPPPPGPGGGPSGGGPGGGGPGGGPGGPSGGPGGGPSTGGGPGRRPLGTYDDPIRVKMVAEEVKITQEHIDKLHRVNERLGTWDTTIGAAISSGDTLTKEQIKYARTMGGLAQDISKVGVGAKAARGVDAQEFWDAEKVYRAAGGPARLADARAEADAQDLRRQELKAQGVDPDAEIEPGGLRMRMAKGLRGLTSGWELMRMRRMWGMTGGPVFQQMIPAAAEASMAQYGAATAIGGFQPGEAPGGVAGGLMQYQAAQRQSMIEAGRTGYQVWGAGLLGGAQNAMRGAQAVAGPAVGAGLIAGGLASTLGFGGSGLAGMAAVGLPVTGAVAAAGGAYAAGRYAWTRAEATPENELRGRDLYQQSTDRDASWGSRLSASFAEMPDLAGAILRGEATAFGEWDTSDKPGIMEWRAQRAARGTALTETAFDDQTLGQRGASLSWAARQLIDQGGAFANYDENQIMQMFQSAAGYGGLPEDASQLVNATPRELDIIATTGRDYESYEQLASQLRLGPEGAGTLLNQIGYSSAEDIRGYEHTLGKWAPIAGAMSMRQREGLVAGVTGAPTEEQIALGRNVPAPVAPIAPPSTRGANRLSPVMGQIIGLQTAGVLPEEFVPDRPTEDWINQQYELMPGYAAFGGMQGQLFGQGYGGAVATRATAAAGAVGGMQGIGAARRLIGGDFSAVQQFSAGQAGLETAGGVPVGRLYDAMKAALDTSPVFKQQLEALEELPSLLEESGHAMGTTQMPAGWAEGLSPIGVSDARWAGAVDTATTRGRRGLQADQIAVTSAYQDFQLEAREASVNMQSAAQFGGTMRNVYSGESMETRGSFEIVRELRGLSRQWEDFSSDYGKQQRELAGRQFMENWQVQMDRLPQRFERQREDLAFQGTQQAIQYGWQMEDTQEQLRFATGRDRRRILRQQERSTIMFGMNQGRLDTFGQRVDQDEEQANEDMERSRRHFEERQALQDSYQNQYRSYIEERRRLEDELQSIQEFQARFNIDAANEQLAKQREMQAELRAINEAYRLMNQTLENASVKGQSIANMFAYVVGQVDNGGPVHVAFEGLFNDIQDWINDININLSVTE